MSSSTEPPQMIRMINTYKQKSSTSVKLRTHQIFLKTNRNLEMNPPEKILKPYHSLDHVSFVVSQSFDGVKHVHDVLLLDRSSR